MELLQIIIAVELGLILLVLIVHDAQEDPSVAKWRYEIERRMKSIDDNLQMAEKSLHARRDWYKQQGGY